MTDDDLRELAYSAHEEAMSFGLSHETFLRYFKTIRNRMVAAPKAQPIPTRAVIERGWADFKYAQGTRECIAFNRGVMFAEEHHGIAAGVALGDGGKNNG